MQGTDYRERVPVPGWVMPVAGALGGLWVARRLQRLRKRRSAFMKVFSLINAVGTATTVLAVVRRFAYVAVEVSDDVIHLGFGPMERSIPASSVRDVRVTTYNPLPFLGWGYRFSTDGRRAFSQIGVRRGVEILTQENGRQRRYFVSSNEPEALASAIATVAGVGATA